MLISAIKKDHLPAAVRLPDCEFWILTHMKSNESWHRIMTIAAIKMTHVNRSEYHQKTLIKFETIKMNETKGENPSALFDCTIVIVCIK